MHALKLSLVTKTGSAPERWARGLSVMLEKIAGVALVTKLQAIFLMEADFNFHNKLIFSNRMLDLARKHRLVPEEVLSKKGRTAEDTVLHQVLVYDNARQKRALIIVASVGQASSLLQNKSTASFLPNFPSLPSLPSQRRRASSYLRNKSTSQRRLSKIDS